MSAATDVHTRIELLLTGDSYRTTLNEKAKTNDTDEQDRMLKACHKRCAERTFKVLEKNGGIFIKLGQHLVRASINTVARTFTDQL
jgi:predicted unusual protein kinase regulating ubiquinone biosynthesis (AarF/ABC1/UbiB family)